MAKNHLMDDPYFLNIIMRIESRITEADREARDAGIVLPKDSAVKSALRKTELALSGKPPVNPPKDPLEEWIANLSASLVGMAGDLEATAGIRTADFLKTLSAARQSLDTRREMAGTPRGYLDFLEGFIEQARSL